MKYLMILNDAPYGTERSYNGLRLARSLLKTGEAEVKVFLVGDAAACAKHGQKVPQGYYSIGDMLGMVVRNGGEVGACGSCLDARGITDKELIEGASRSTMDQLTTWTQWADKVIVF
ncbi:MAG: DsrE family protein [Nitrosomonadales bacterium]|nr:DsrE family protein [Nitrosomonadales bacterium]